MKRVAVQGDLKEIKEALSNKGYVIVDFEDGGNVDAIVYTNDHRGISNLNNNVTAEAGEVGAVLINAYNKGIDEIEYIIEKRRYGRLFS